MTASRLGRPRTYASVEDAYRAHAVPTAQGHVRWTGPTTSIHRTPVVNHGDTSVSAYRIAFQLHHGRAPEGIVRITCGTKHCVAGAHLEDAVMRQAGNAPRPRRKPGPKGVPTSEILAAIGQGLSDHAIGNALRTNPRRVKQIREAHGLPRPTRSGPTLLEAWEARTRPADGGHLEWTGSVHMKTPAFRHEGRLYMARRVAFQTAHGRDPVGEVRPGCDRPGCVAPAHVEDQPMRDQYNAIFGAAA
ncbi:hypothetical protein ACFW6E_08765 [Streptomyces olivaceoviridis]|uniref:hypothetical protein n=1 Tax=Streptomyces olivaceoviridis TaxID=1921 RepID=UPI00369A202A